MSSLIASMIFTDCLGVFWLPFFAMHLMPSICFFFNFEYLFSTNRMRFVLLSFNTAGCLTEGEASIVA